MKARIRASGAAWMRIGWPAEGTSARSARVSATAITRPSAPPAIDSTRLSTSSWRTSCPRVAPIDRRTAISRCRMNPRAMSRFATLAQAMSSTSPTMHMSTMSAVEKSLRSDE